MKGKYKNIIDVEEDGRYINNLEVNILYKEDNDLSNDQIAIIETFFEKK